MILEGSIGKIMVNCAMYIRILKNTPYIYGFFCKDVRRQASVILTDGSAGEPRRLAGHNRCIMWRCSNKFRLFFGR